MTHVFTGSIGILVLGSLALAQTPPPEADPFTVERAFKEGGKVALQLSSGDYTVRAGASDRIVVRWTPDHQARLKDVQDLRVSVRVTGSTGTIVTSGKADHTDFLIELPARSDVHLRMRAGEITLQGIDGHKDIRMTAGELKIGVRRETLIQYLPDMM